MMYDTPQKVDAARRKLGWSVVETARRAKCSRPNLQNWLTGERKNIMIGTLKRINMAISRGERSVAAKRQLELPHDAIGKKTRRRAEPAATK